MSIPAVLKERYRIGERVGQGGMGEVYRAEDLVLESDAAIKILGANSSKQALELFDREWRALRDLHHGNIVSIYDRGEFQDGSLTRPYFVMPFLTGRTLYEIVRDPETRLSVQDVVAIMIRVCEGIAAAHSRGIIHRDIKPGNIFVLEGGAVQVIDFGVAHLSDDKTLTTLKGTTPYIAPELLDPDDRRQPSPSTDLFSLGVVCYEALTRIQPFERDTVKDTIRAILRYMPKPAVDVNPEIGMVLSQVVQKTMAKADTSRYRSVAEFAEKMQKAVRNEPLPEFDRSTIEPRLRSISDSLSRGKLEAAESMLRSLESEGYSDAAISSLRLRVDQAFELRTVEQLLETVQFQRDAGQYLDALGTLDKVLQAVPQNVTALSVKAQVEHEWVQSCVSDARQYTAHRDFGTARKLLLDAQKLRPTDTQLIELLAAVSRAEEHESALRKEKEAFYQDARKAFRDGEMSAALDKLEAIKRLQGQAGNSVSDRDMVYSEFAREVETEQSRIQSAYQEIQSNLADHKYSQALAVCDQMLVTNPGHALFLAARLDIENRERKVRLDYITEVSARTAAVADLDARVSLLQDAAAKYPTESQLQELLRNVKGKRDLINSTVAYARTREERGEFAEALERWRLIQSFHPQYPAVNAEVDRLHERHVEQVQSGRKAIALRRIDQLLEDGAYDDANRAGSELLNDFPNDPQILSRIEIATESALHAHEAEELLVTGQIHLQQGQFDEAVQHLRKALELDGRREAIRHTLALALAESVRQMPEYDWEIAEPLIRDAVRLQPNDASLRSLAGVIADRKERALVDQACVAAFKLAGNAEAALEVVDKALVNYPSNSRLLEQREKLLRALGHPPRVKPVVVSDKQVSLPEDPPVGGSQPSPKEAVPKPRIDGIPTIVMEQRRRAPESAGGSAGSSVTARASAMAQSVRAGAILAAGKFRSWIGTLEGASTPHLKRARIPLSPRAALAGALAGSSIILLFFVIWATKRNNPPPTAPLLPAALAVNVDLSPPGSDLLVDGRRVSGDAIPLPITRGAHRFEVKSPGFNPVTEVRDIQKSDTLLFHLQPLQPSLHLKMSDDTTKIRIDDTDRGTGVGGSFESANLTSGRHVIEAMNQKGNGRFVIALEDGKVPAVTELPKAKVPAMLLVGLFDGRVSVRSNVSGRLMVNGQPAGDLTEGAIELKAPAGNFEIGLENESSSKLAMSLRPEPAVFVSTWWPQPKITAEARVQQAQILTQEAQYEQALRILDSVLREVPNHVAAKALKLRVTKAIEIKNRYGDK